MRADRAASCHVPARPARAQNAIDQGETKVKVYGQMSALGKLTAKLFSPDTYARFDETTQELNALAMQVGAVGDAARGRAGCLGVAFAALNTGVGGGCGGGCGSGHGGWPCRPSQRVHVQLLICLSCT